MSSLRPPVEGPRTTLDDPSAGPVELYGPAPGAPAEGTPLLLVHSVNAAASAYEMRPLYEDLAASRPTYALDLPGFGLSDRSDRQYSARIMTDAIHAAVRAVRARHDGAPVDLAALSLSCEFAARAVTEEPTAIRTLALISPTAFDQRRDDPAGGNRGMNTFRAIVAAPVWSGGLFGLLTTRGVVKYFLERTYGRKGIDQGLWDYAYETAQAPGAKHAPLWFLSGHLFSKDATLLYERLELPVWVSHGVRGDFQEYGQLEAVQAKPNWSVNVYDTGALPHYEKREEFVAAYREFLGS